MPGLLHLLERNEADVIGLPHLFERPARAHVPRLTLAAVGRAFERGDGRDHRQAPGASRPFVEGDVGKHFSRFNKASHSEDDPPMHFPTISGFDRR
jgi:hypothetical protein